MEMTNFKVTPVEYREILNLTPGTNDIDKLLTPLITRFLEPSPYWDMLAVLTADGFTKNLQQKISEDIEKKAREIKNPPDGVRYIERKPDDY